MACGNIYVIASISMLHCKPIILGLKKKSAEKQRKRIRIKICRLLKDILGITEV